MVPGPDGEPRIDLGLLELAKTYAKDGLFGCWLGSYYVAVVTKPAMAKQVRTEDES